MSERPLPSEPPPDPVQFVGSTPRARPASDPYRALFENLPVGVYRSTLGGVIVDANAALLRMLGFASLEELARVNMVDLYVDPEDRLRWIDIMERDGVVTEYEVRKRRRDGTVIWIRDSARAVQSADGRAVFEGVVVEVTKRRETEEALRKSEGRYRALVEAVPDAILRIGSDGLCLDASEGSSSPIRRGDVVRKHVSEVFPPEAAELLLREIERCVSTGERSSFECTGPGGKEQELCLSASGRDDVLVLIQDVGERQRLNAHLVRSERLASVGVLAGGVAHEINNPLSYVSTNIEFAVRAIGRCTADLDAIAAVLPAPSKDAFAGLRETLADAREALEEASEGEARVRRIVQELKDFARDTDGAPGSVDARSILESSIKLVANQLRGRAVLIRDFEDVGDVAGETSRLGQVFVNLLVNAAQAIEAGHTERNHVRVALHEAPGGRVVVEVTDSGRGIDPHQLPMIFDPFYTTKEGGIGAGLGLSICHNIISSYGGEITVESTVGEGTTFRVWLRAVGMSRRDPSTMPPEPSAVIRGRVLIIDDEPLIGRAFERALARRHDVRVTTDGREALAWIADGERFDAIFCDMMMPAMSGMRVYERLCDEAPAQAARVVFMTGGAFADTVADFLDSVGNRSLQKPLSIGQMNDAVASLMQGSPSQDS